MHHRIGNPLHDDQIGKQTRTDAANEMIESGGTRRVVADQSDSSRKIERTAVNEPKDDRQKRSRIVIGAKPIDCTSFDSSDCAQVSAAGLSSQDVRRPHTDGHTGSVCSLCSIHRRGEFGNAQTVFDPLRHFCRRIIVVTGDRQIVARCQFNHLPDPTRNISLCSAFANQDLVDFGIAPTAGLGDICPEHLLIRILALSWTVIHNRDKAQKRVTEHRLQRFQTTLTADLNAGMDQMPGAAVPIHTQAMEKIVHEAITAHPKFGIIE
jgi:hypothetical protein